MTSQCTLTPLPGWWLQYTSSQVLTPPTCQVKLREVKHGLFSLLWSSLGDELRLKKERKIQQCMGPLITSQIQLSPGRATVPQSVTWPRLLGLGRTSIALPLSVPTPLLLIPPGPSSPHLRVRPPRLSCRCCPPLSSAPVDSCSAHLALLGRHAEQPPEGASLQDPGDRRPRRGQDQHHQALCAPQLQPQLPRHHRRGLCAQSAELGPGDGAAAALGHRRYRPTAERAPKHCNKVLLSLPGFNWDRVL